MGGWGVFTGYQAELRVMEDKKIDTKIVTEQEIEAKKTKNGGWTKSTLAEWGVPWPPKPGWKARLIEASKKFIQSQNTDRRF